MAHQRPRRFWSSCLPAGSMCARGGYCARGFTRPANALPTSAPVPGFVGGARRVAFGHPAQPLGHPATLLREFPVAGGVLPVFVLGENAVFGHFVVRLRGPVVAVRGSVQAVGRGSLRGPRLPPRPFGSLPGVERFLGAPHLEVRISPESVICAAHHPAPFSFGELTGLVLPKRPSTTLVMSTNRGRRPASGDLPCAPGH